MRTGGTTICKLAEANGMRSDFTNNCLWERPENAVREQIMDFSVSNWTFMAIEYNHLPFGDDDLPLPGDVVYIITIRDPLERMLSYLRHNKQYGHIPQNTTFVKYATTVTGGGLISGKQSRNFYLNLVGCCGNDDPKYAGCTEASLIKAKRRLEYFSVIMVSDDQDTFLATARMLGTRLGWRNTNVSVLLCDSCRGGDVFFMNANGIIDITGRRV